MIANMKLDLRLLLASDELRPDLELMRLEDWVMIL